MSARNGSASDADCRISEDCHVPDVELMELGPLLEEGGGRHAASKGVHPEVRESSLRTHPETFLLSSFNFLLWSLLKGAAMLADEEEEDDDEVGGVMTLPLQAHHAMEKMEEFVHKVTMSINLNTCWTGQPIVSNLGFGEIQYLQFLAVM